ncbi:MULTISPECIES: helix-turn-helix domain-containing protein [Halobacteriales]|nr:hypothetical protein [Natrinema salifodinae]
MDQLDELILEFLEAMGSPGGEAVALPPTSVWLNLAKVRESTDKRQNTVSRHMSALADAGLLEKVDKDRGYYTITDLGRRYVNNELSNEEIEEIKSKL